MLLIIELYLIVTIVKGLWQARKLSGDPRIHTFEQYQDDEKKLAVALLLALGAQPVGITLFLVLPVIIQRQLRA